MKIGISTVLFHRSAIEYSESPRNIFSVLEQLSIMGYKFIEINTRSLPHPFSVECENMKKIAEGRGSLQFEVRSIHISNNPGDIGSLDPKVRQEAIEWIERSLDLCQVFKPDYVGIHHGGHNEALYGYRSWEAVKGYIVESTGRLAGFARDRGIKLALENIEFDINRMNEIIHSLPEDDVGLLVDVGHYWSKLRRDPAEAIRKAGNRLCLLHINDNDGRDDDHLIPGEGTINWWNTLKALEDVNYKGVFMNECINSKTTKDKNAIARLAKKTSQRLLTKQIE